MSANDPLRHTLISPFRDGDLFAAVDMGSNSFHMLVARYTLGQFRTIDRIREMVRMADGLDSKGRLAPAVQQRALECLQRFGERIRDIPPQRVRAVATNTVRALAQPQQFLRPAETALRHRIDVVSGREEARLVYLGVAHGQPPRAGRLRLVIDIGGGSTECIIGNGYDSLERESLQLGCVASTRRFFADGKLSRKRWLKASTEIKAEFQQFSRTYRGLGWDEVLGSSGTIKAIGKICAAMNLTKGSITLDALTHIRDKMLSAETLAAIELPGLSKERQPVIAGGVLILQAAFEILNIDSMTASRTALREGILLDMLGRGSGDDPRAASVAAIMQRYGIDLPQAQRVERTTMHLFDQIAASWQLHEEDRAMLAWACRLHEVGLMIAHSQYHIHGAYVLENSDIAGFSQQEQALLAALVRSHRRNIGKSAFNAIPERMLTNAKRCTALLRLAVLLHRSHEADPIPALRLDAHGNQLQLTLPADWLATRPLLHTDLKNEPAHFAGLGMSLHIDSV